jgi:hypothetical protein
METHEQENINIHNDIAVWSESFNHLKQNN